MFRGIFIFYLGVRLWVVGGKDSGGRRGEGGRFLWRVGSYWDV